MELSVPWFKLWLEEEVVLMICNSRALCKYTRIWVSSDPYFPISGKHGSDKTPILAYWFCFHVSLFYCLILNRQCLNLKWSYRKLKKYSGKSCGHEIFCGTFMSTAFSACTVLKFVDKLPAILPIELVWFVNEGILTLG